MSGKDSNFDHNEIKPVHTNKVGGSPFKGVVGWIDNRLPIIRMFKYEYLDFQVPKKFKLSLELGWNIHDMINIFNCYRFSSWNALQTIFI